MFGLGMGELVVIGVFALLFIGPKKLPELAKGLGRGIREFQKAKDEIVKSVKDPDYGTEATDDVKHLSSIETDNKENNDIAIDESTKSVDEIKLTEVNSTQATSIARGEVNSNAAQEINSSTDQVAEIEKKS